MHTFKNITQNKLWHTSSCIEQFHTEDEPYVLTKSIWHIKSRTWKG